MNVWDLKYTFSDIDMRIIAFGFLLIAIIIHLTCAMLQPFWNQIEVWNMYTL